MRDADILPGLVAAMEALERSRAARCRAPAEPPYPQLMILGGHWVERSYPGGPWLVVSQFDAEQRLGLREVA